jgi:alanine racemase
MGELLRHSPGDGAVLTIDLGALVGNYEFLRRTAAPAICAAAVKANAYGLGVDRVAAALATAGCEVFFVSTNNEGIELRQILPDATIYVLNGLIPGTEQTFADFNLRPVLNDLDQIDAWSFFARGRKGVNNAAALHFDTGMNRLGLDARDTRSLIASPERIAFDVALVMSHLACADMPEAPMNAEQLATFTQLLRDFNRSRPAAKPAPGSIANSAGILTGAAFHLDMVRPGIGLYGGNPFASRPNPMRQVIRLQGKILQLRDIAAGDSVGYNATYRAPGPRKIATVDVGYADGYLRSFSNRGIAFIGDFEVPVIGRVSMDMLAVDVTGVPAKLLAPGAAIDLLGGPVPPDAATKASGLSAYELLTLLGHRYKRRYIDVVEQKKK